MSGKRPFGKLKGKSQFTSATNISFRFNPLDEELEEISLGEKETSKVVNNDFNKELSKSSYQTEVFKETNNLSENDDKLPKVPNPEVTLLTALKNDDPSARDSVKDYLSRFGRRACSLDSEADSNVESEGWLKDLTGIITKNLEDCITKDIKGLISEDEVIKGLPCTRDSKDSTALLSTSEPTTSTHSLSKIDSRISPSVELTGSLEEKDFLDYLTESPVGKVSLETSITSDPISTSDMGLLYKTKTGSPAFNMTLSSLIAARSSSFDDEKSENIKKVAVSESKPIAVIAKEASSFESSSPKADSMSKPSSGTLSNLFLNTHLYYRYVTSMWNSTVSYILVAVLACLVAPLPSLVSGFLIGVILASTMMYWLIKPSTIRPKYSIPDYTNPPNLASDNSTESSNESILHKGWMNQLLFEYNPDTYHVNCTHSVYIRINSSYLRVSYPKTNIPKRAMFNETRPELGFVHQQLYKISKLLSVELLPEELCERRLWIKKYPICLIFSGAESPVHQEAALATRQSPKESAAKRYQPVVNKNGDTVLYLFARTDREKDDWYRRFLKVSKIKLLKSHSPSSTPNIVGLDNSSLEGKRAISVDLGSLHMSSSFGNISSIEEREFNDEDDDAFTELRFDKQFSFEHYMSQLLSSPRDSSKTKTSVRSKVDLLDYKASPTPSISQNQGSQDLLWLNALIGRSFFDFLKESFWAGVVSDRIQRKLSKIKLPHFIDELKVTGIKLGSSLPKINRASNPVVDQRGLWIDLDVSYNGSFQMTLETKLNLTRLRKSDGDSMSIDCKEQELEEMPIRSRVYDNDEDDTAESSSDDDVPMPDMSSLEESLSTVAGGSKGKKLIRIVDKIAQSSYFQSAAKNKYVKRAIEGVSNTPLALTVEIRWLTGTLALNFPPMPTNRLWYGFRKNPDLSLVARPKLGCHAVKFVHIHEWIEKKLILEFQKVLVMPNMDDLIIPIMQSKEEAET